MRYPQKAVPNIVFRVVYDQKLMFPCTSSKFHYAHRTETGKNSRIYSAAQQTMLDGKVFPYGCIHIDYSQYEVHGDVFLLKSVFQSVYLSSEKQNTSNCPKCTCDIPLWEKKSTNSLHWDQNGLWTRDNSGSLINCFSIDFNRQVLLKTLEVVWSIYGVFYPLAHLRQLSGNWSQT